MELIVVGAGASIEEGLRIGLSEEECPPSMADFAKKMWALNDQSYAPNHLLHPYLLEHGYNPGENATDVFIKLIDESAENINVERFFEWVWRNTDKFYEGAWKDLVYHGIGSALVFLLIKFHVNGVGWKELQASKLVASKLRPNDLVVNLNYDTLFEMGAEQADSKFVYVPNQPDAEQFRIAKPHGSLNLVVSENSFAFGQPEFMHMVLQPGETTEHLRGIVPPRFHKEYMQHPIAKIILELVSNEEPDKLTFWGVGLTDSDTDLIDLYNSWAQSARSVVMINPNPDTTAVKRAEDLLNVNIDHLLNVEAWLEITK